MFEPLLEAVAMMSDAMETILVALEVRAIQTPLGLLPYMVLIQGFITASLFRPALTASAAEHWLLLVLHMIFNLSGHFVTAFLLAVPPPFLEYNLILPGFVATWIVSCYTPFLLDVLALVPVQLATRLFVCAALTLGMTTFGVDEVARRNISPALNHSVIAPILHGALFTAAGNAVVVGFWYLWTSHPDTRTKPLPIQASPDFQWLGLRKTLFASTVYYMLTQHDMLVTHGLLLSRAEARFAVFLIMVIFEFLGPAVPSYPSQHGPTPKDKKDV